MNGWYLLFWLASVLAVLSVPVVLLAVLARLVGRLGQQPLAAVLAAAAALWGIALVFWRYVSPS